jgi:hypothetical protein
VDDQYQDDRADTTNDTRKFGEDNEEPLRLAPNTFSRLDWHFRLVFFVKTLLWEKNDLLKESLWLDRTGIENHNSAFTERRYCALEFFRRIGKFFVKKGSSSLVGLLGCFVFSNV